MQKNYTLFFLAYINICRWFNNKYYSWYFLLFKFHLMILGGAKSNTLLKVALDIIDNNYCNSFYQDIRRILPQGIAKSMMCAGILQGGKDTCQVI